MQLLEWDRDLCATQNIVDQNVLVHRRGFEDAVRRAPHPLLGLGSRAPADPARGPARAAGGCRVLHDRRTVTPQPRLGRARSRRAVRVRPGEGRTATVETMTRGAEGAVHARDRPPRRAPGDRVADVRGLRRSSRLRLRGTRPHTCSPSRRVVEQDPAAARSRPALRRRGLGRQRRGHRRRLRRHRGSDGDARVRPSRRAQPARRPCAELRRHGPAGRQPRPPIPRARCGACRNTRNTSGGRTRRYSMSSATDCASPCGPRARRPGGSAWAASTSSGTASPTIPRPGRGSSTSRAFRSRSG